MHFLTPKKDSTKDGEKYLKSVSTIKTNTYNSSENVSKYINTMYI
jgi:hypothetical protein